MHVIRRRGWEIPERRVTPEAVYLNRRQIVAGVGAALAGGAAASFSLPAWAQADQTTDLYPAPRNTRYKIEADRSVTPESLSARYNNFYEFRTDKYVADAAEALSTRPWDVTIDGMVEKPITIGIDELIRKMTLEERVYRHRCVEGWSMVVSWTGFPLARLVDFARPLGSARYLRMETFLKPEIAGGQRQTWYPWPYVEGLTITEAVNELAFMVTGAYGHPVAKVMGAPLRVHLPWKYGFKSIKSIVRFTFTEDRPVSFWETIGTKGFYGFWANVNPDVPAADRSQAQELILGTDQWVPTELYNGYGEYVAAMYAGIIGEELFR